jgi:hypothetical protein
MLRSWPPRRLNLKWYKHEMKMTMRESPNWFLVSIIPLFILIGIEMGWAFGSWPSPREALRIYHNIINDSWPHDLIRLGLFLLAITLCVEKNVAFVLAGLCSYELVFRRLIEWIRKFFR